MKEFKKFIDLLQSTNSRLEKERILQTATQQQKEVLEFLFNPYKVTGISKKKVSSRPTPLKSSNASIQDVIEMLNYLSIHNTGSYADVDFALQVAVDSDFPDLVISLFTRSLTLGVGSTTLNKIYGKDFIPKFGVMLAASYFSDPQKYLPQGTPFIITEKLDGVRCVLIFDDTGRPHLFARSGREIEGLVDLEKEALNFPRDYVIDGELKVDTGSSNEDYRATMSIVGSDLERKTGVYFNAFDFVQKTSFIEGLDTTPAETRKTSLELLLKRSDSKWFRFVPVLYSGTDQTQIYKWLDWAKANHKEGVMINLANAPYEVTRSTGLLKVKTFKECEAVVRKVQEGGGRNQGKLGSVLCDLKDETGRFHSVQVGSGFSDEERVRFYQSPELLEGKVVEIGYFEVTHNKGDDTLSLRFPTWLGRIRTDKDEDSMTPISI